MVFLTDQLHLCAGCHDLLNFDSGIVTGAIIDNDDLQLALVVCFQKRPKRRRDNLAFVVSSDNDASRFS